MAKKAATPFPIRKGEHVMAAIYFDHAATTPMHPEVVAVMTQALTESFGNPSSIHQFGRRAHQQLTAARQIVASSLNAKPHEIIFNSGGTEGDNTAIIQTALARKAEGMHIITTAIEHPAVLEPMKYLASLGFDITYLPVDQTGMIALADLQAALRPETILVSVMFANNETGNILPIAEIGAILKAHPATFHVDAVQAYGALPIDVTALGIDLLSVSAHKFNGPKGVGFLYKKDGVNFSSFLKGGEQEEKRRAGTENLPGILGMAKAITLLTPAEKARRKVYLQKLADTLIAQLKASDIEFSLNGNLENKLPHVLNLRLPRVNHDILLTRLDLAGMAVSSGSACTAGNIEPSHVLAAMYGEESPILKESLRVSFGYENTLEEVEQFSQRLIAEVSRLQKKD